MVTTSTKKMEEDGLRLKIEYVMRLSNPENPNPDHLTKYPNECKKSNTNRIQDITKRVTHEFQLWKAMKDMRIAKRTGKRRISA